MLTARAQRYFFTAFILAALTLFLIIFDEPKRVAQNYIEKHRDGEKPAPPTGPKYIPEPDYKPPPIKDPFPGLTTARPPAVPEWNIPKADLHKKYGLQDAPPLFIGFTRGWPILLQSVVSYITAGWPASQIYVIENTGVQGSNARGKLSLQNPFYLNHLMLEKLGVNVVEAPVLMTFAQLQNFYIHLAHKHNFEYYFWSHQDVLVFSMEDGHQDEGHKGTPKATEPGYKTMYEMGLAELNHTIHNDPRWGLRWFAYDHLTLVNREAYDFVGGWDPYIPYYINDCDFHERLRMANYTTEGRKIAYIHDVNTALADLIVLYRDKSVEPAYVDPNPPKPEEKKEGDKGKREWEGEEEIQAAIVKDGDSEDRKYWRKLMKTGNDMVTYKKSSRDRNTWQLGQRGGEGEPYYYPARGIQVAFDILTGAGKNVYEEKWGHKNCALQKDGMLKLADQWRVEHNWDR